MKDNICVHHLTSSMVRLNADDIYRARYLSDVQYNDRRILFTVTQPDRRANDYLSSVWIYEGGLRKFTVGPRDYGARWSADGSSVIFVSDRGRGEDRKDVSGLYSIRADGGEAERICEFKGKIDSPVIQKDGRGVFFLGTTKAETEKKGSDVKTVRKFPFYFNAKGFLDGRETQIYHTSLRGKISKITKGPFVISQFDVSSNRIVFAARSEEWDTYTTDLFICGLRGGRIRSITGMPAGYGSPSFSPDGRTVAFTFRNNKEGFFQHSHISFMPSTGGEMRHVQDFDRNPGNSLNSDTRVSQELLLRWKNDGSGVFYTATDRGKCRIYAADALSLTTAAVMDVDRSVESFDLMEGGFAFVGQNSSLPTELYEFRKGKIKRLTRLNKYLESRKLKEPEHFSFRSSDGLVIDGWILSYGNRRGPAILEIHGGPKTAYGDTFMFEFQLLAQSGYTVVFFNPRGSDGYENSFSQAVKGHFGEADYSDIMEGLDFALKKFGLNGGRLGVTGGSYGGFMTN